MVCLSIVGDWRRIETIKSIQDYDNDRMAIIHTNQYSMRGQSTQHMRGGMNILKFLKIHNINRKKMRIYK